MKIMTKGFIAAMFLFGSTQAIADKVMTQDEIKTLIVGNTVYSTHTKKNFDFKVYFNSDGTFERSQNGKMLNGVWMFDGGMHCIAMGKKICASVVDNGDGTYKRLNNGSKHVVTWNKVVKGKDL